MNSTYENKNFIHIYTHMGQLTLSFLLKARKKGGTKNICFQTYSILFGKLRILHFKDSNYAQESN